MTHLKTKFNWWQWDHRCIQRMLSKHLLLIRQQKNQQPSDIWEQLIKKAHCLISPEDSTMLWNVSFSDTLQNSIYTLYASYGNKKQSLCETTVNIPVWAQHIKLFQPSVKLQGQSTGQHSKLWYSWLLQDVL